MTVDFKTELNVVRQEITISHSQLAQSLGEDRENLRRQQDLSTRLDVRSLPLILLGIIIGTTPELFVLLVPWWITWLIMFFIFLMSAYWLIAKVVSRRNPRDRVSIRK